MLYGGAYPYGFVVRLIALLSDYQIICQLGWVSQIHLNDDIGDDVAGRGWRVERPA
jgi:hypothetical protein